MQPPLHSSFTNTVILAISDRHPRWGVARVPRQDQAETKSGTRISRVILLDRFIRHDGFSSIQSNG